MRDWFQPLAHLNGQDPHGYIGSLTDIAVNVKLDIGVIGPYDSIHTVSQTLEEEPEAQKRDTEVPALPNEAS